MLPTQTSQTNHNNYSKQARSQDITQQGMRDEGEVLEIHQRQLQKLPNAEEILIYPKFTTWRLLYPWPGTDDSQQMLAMLVSKTGQSASMEY